MGEQAVIEREGAERTINVERENITFSGGASSFNELTDRPKYANEEMTSETNIPSVSAETTARQEADNSLQQQIDALAASSDVTDIVGTYAALQAYDTSKLSDNDIIKVLQDETHDNETTYYRWSTSTETFTLIGEEGPYYTKSATDTLLAGKQDKLTAGANITIDANNEISATDTTYNDFIGTDGTATGTAGLVPAPLATDAGKFLKADGTWDTVAAGPTVVQTTGTSTTDVMSQNAVSRLIFPSETDKTRLAIGINASASANSTIAIGGVSNRQTLASGSRGVAIGLNARATEYCSVAIGGDTDSSSYGATANYSHSIAIGSYSITGRTREFSLGGVNYSGNIVTRYIANVTDPTLPQDAATKNYVDTAVAGAGATVLTNTQYNNLWSNA